MVTLQTTMLLIKETLKSSLMLCPKVMIVFMNCLKNVKKKENATLNLKAIQNQLLSRVRKCILVCINQEINEEKTSYFGVVADEVTDSDCASWEQLGIVIINKPVERLIEYVKCDNIREETIAKY